MRDYWRHPAIQYLAYGLTVTLLATLFYAGLVDHLLDDHDAENFRDNAKISHDFLFFFSPDKEQAAGRLPSEFAKWLISLVDGANPGVFHFVNVVVHALVAMVLPLAYRATGFSFATGALAGLLFLMNVGHFNAIHRITQLDYLLAMLFSLVAVALFGRFLSTRRPLWPRLAALAALLAVATHGAFLALFPFALYWAFRTRPDWRLIAKWLGGIALVSAGLALGLLMITVRDAPVWDLVRSLDSIGSLFANLSLALRHLGLFLGRLVTTAHWILVPIHTSYPWEPFAGLLVGALGAYALYKRVRPLDLWIVWTALTLLPFTPISDQGLFQSPTGFSRYLYFATAGASLILAWSVQQAARLLTARAPGWGPAVPFIALALLAVSSYRSAQQTEALSIYSSARHYNASRDFATAIERLQTVLTLNTAAVPLDQVYAYLVVLLPDDSELRNLLDEALHRYPGHPELHTKMALLEQLSANPAVQQQGRGRLNAVWEGAQAGGHEQNFSQNLGAALRHQGRNYLKRGEWSQAAQTFAIAINWFRSDESFAERHGFARFMLGRDYAARNRPSQARAEYRKALDQYRKITSWNPDNTRCVLATVLVLRAAGDTAAADAAQRAAVTKVGRDEARDVLADLAGEMTRYSFSRVR